MSQNRSLSRIQSKWAAFLKTYSIGLTDSNAALIIGHPAERLKVAAQINLNIPTYRVIKPIFEFS